MFAELARVEHIVVQHPLVEAAVMFGRAQAQAGILIQPIDSHEFPPNDRVKLNKFREDVWSVSDISP